MEAEVGNDKHHLGTSSARSAVEDQPLTSKFNDMVPGKDRSLLDRQLCDNKDTFSDMQHKP